MQGAYSKLQEQARRMVFIILYSIDARLPISWNYFLNIVRNERRSERREVQMRFEDLNESISVEAEYIFENENKIA